MKPYREKHHIIPRCLGGSDDPSNLVELTWDDHKEAHLILHVLNRNHSGLKAAYLLMHNETEDGRKARLKFASECANNPESKRKAAITRKQNGKTWKNSETTKQKKSEVKREWWSSKDGEKRKQIRFSGSIKEFHYLFIGPPKPPSLKNLNSLKITCPTCGKEGQFPNMKRWHFDNCRES